MNLSEIQRLVERGQYSVRWDAVLHALKEDFTEADIVKALTVEYERNGITVQVSDVPAMVCPNCGTRSFPPGIADKIIGAVNEMLAAAERTRQQVPDLERYLVSMTTPATRAAEQQASYKVE